MLGDVGVVNQIIHQHLVLSSLSYSFVSNILLYFPVLLHNAWIQTIWCWAMPKLNK